MKLHLYLDTSVFSLAVDERSPERQSLTLEFFRKIGEYHVITSEVARREIMETKDPAIQQRILRILDLVEVLPVTRDVVDLAEDLVQAEVFTSAMLDDATHVAAAVYMNADVLVSWNFKHLVNRRRRALINSLFVIKGLPPIEILSPPEV